MVGKRQTKSLCLEDYENYNAENLTINQLNEVIFMHGFRKIRKCPKAVLYDALSTIDLMKPPEIRSTLGDDFSPPYSFSVSIDEVKADLEALKWLECPFVQSVETVGKPESNGGRRCSVAVEDRGFAISSMKVNRKRRKPRVKRMTRWSLTDGGFGFDRSSSSIAGDGADVDGGVGGNCHGGFVESMAGLGAGRYLFVDTYSWEV